MNASILRDKWGRNKVCRTSVQRITLPLALNSEPWKILTLVIDSMDLPSMGLMTLKTQERAQIIKTQRSRLRKHTDLTAFPNKVSAHLLKSLNYYCTE